MQNPYSINELLVDKSLKIIDSINVILELSETNLNLKQRTILKEKIHEIRKNLNEMEGLIKI